MVDVEKLIENFKCIGHLVRKMAEMHQLDPCKPHFQASTPLVELIRTLKARPGRFRSVRYCEGKIFAQLMIDELEEWRAAVTIVLTANVD